MIFLVLVFILILIIVYKRSNKIPSFTYSRIKVHKFFAILCLIIGLIYLADISIEHNTYEGELNIVHNSTQKYTTTLIGDYEELYNINVIRQLQQGDLTQIHVSKLLNRVDKVYQIYEDGSKAIIYKSDMLSIVVLISMFFIPMLLFIKYPKEKKLNKFIYLIANIVTIPMFIWGAIVLLISSLKQYLSFDIIRYIEIYNYGVVIIIYSLLFLLSSYLLISKKLVIIPNYIYILCLSFLLVDSVSFYNNISLHGQLILSTVTILASLLMSYKANFNRFVIRNINCNDIINLLNLKKAESIYEINADGFKYYHFNEEVIGFKNINKKNRDNGFLLDLKQIKNVERRKDVFSLLDLNIWLNKRKLTTNSSNLYSYVIMGVLGLVLMFFGIMELGLFNFHI